MVSLGTGPTNTVVCVFFLTSMLVYQRVIIIYYNRPEVDRV